MASFKVVISDPKSGATQQREVSGDDANSLIGLKINDKLSGDVIKLSGYEFVITGGSDFCGFPMRRDISGSQRAKILAVSGIGVRKNKGKGIRQRKTVCGNTISDSIAQVNVKVVKMGSENIFKKDEESSKEGVKENSETKSEVKDKSVENSVVASEKV